ncbi:MAG: hypothetical protein ABIE07_10930 [Candidatus Zixiibacteriota bacterium]
MRKERIIYQDWIVTLGRDPSIPCDGRAEKNSDHYNYEIITAVNRALEILNNDEASFIRAFYMEGLGYRQIGEKSGRAVYKLEALHNRALKKIKRHLYHSLKDKISLPAPSQIECCLCRHPQLEDINQLIMARNKSETWKHIIKTLKNDYGIIIKTPQRLIGHLKYHIIKEA